MTIQRLAHQPVTVTFRSDTGGLLVDANVNVDGIVYSDSDHKDRITKSGHVADGAGEFTFYGKPGTVVQLSVDGAADVEPIQFVGVTDRPGGLAAVHPEDPPEIHAVSPVSEAVTDLSLVGAPPDGSLEKVGVLQAQTTLAGEPEIPDGTDPDAALPSAEDEGTVQDETVPDEGGSHVEPSE